VELALIVIAQIFASLLGRAILRFFFYKEIRKFALAEKIALYYVIGMGLIPLYMMLLNCFGMKFSISTIYLPCALIIVFETLHHTSRKPTLTGAQNSSRSRVRIDPVNAFLSLGIFFVVFYSFFTGLVKPIASFDSVASFAIKAKIFFLGAGIPRGFFENLAQNFPHPRFPLMIPLQETFCFISMGSFNDILVKMIFPAHFLAFAALFYFGLKELTGKRCALIFTFLLCSINEVSRFSAVGYTDIHFSLYLFVGFIYWYRFATTASGGALFSLFIPAVFSAFAIFTKDTGFIVPFLFLLLFVLYSKERKEGKGAILAYVRYLALLIFLILSWLFVRLAPESTHRLMTLNALNPAYLVSAFMDRILPVLYEFQVNVFNPKRWNLLWPIFIVLFILNYKWSLRTRLKYITVFITSIFLLYLFFYITVEPSAFGYGKVYAQSLRSGMNRHLIHVTPFAVLWLALIFKKMCESKKEKA